MKFTVDRAEFAAAAAWVARAVPSRPLEPILSSIHLSAAGDLTEGRVVLTASDIESVTHRAVVDAHVVEDGDAVVVASLLRDLPAAMKGPELTVHRDDEKAGVLLTAGRASYRVGESPTQFWPELATAPAPGHVIAGGELRGLVKIVKPFADDNSAVQEIRGIRVEASDGELRAVATNRFVVAVGRGIPSESDGEFVTQVPAKALDNALGGLTGDVGVGFDGTVLGLVSGDRTVVFRVMDTSKYVDWPKLIRDRHVSTMTVDRDEFVEAVKRGSIVCTNPGDPIWLKILPGEVTIQPGHSSNPEGAEVLDADTEAELDVAFQPQLLNAVLAGFDGKRIEMGFGNPRTTEVPVAHQPVMLVDPDDDSTSHLLMPRHPGKS